MRVTFDTRPYRRVVEPEQLSRDDERALFAAINAAIRDGRIEPFVGEALFTLEALRRADRASYLATRRFRTHVEETSGPQGSIHGRMALGPDHGQHPGLEQPEIERFKKAFKLGFRLLAQPRGGMPRPELARPEECPDHFAADTDISARQETFFQVARAIQARNVGFARAWELGQRAVRRAGREVPWFELLNDDQYFNNDERRELAAAVAEWVDGDNIAAHIAYHNNLFCTEDIGGRTRPSIMNVENRQWLSETYNVRFVTPRELGELLEHTG